MAENPNNEAVNAPTIEVDVFGDTDVEMEAAALDEAFEFFGKQSGLRVIKRYKVQRVHPGGALAAKANGKKYYSTIQVAKMDP